MQPSMIQATEVLMMRHASLAQADHCRVGGRALCLVEGPT
jgi:hypothetical protein